MCIQSAGRDTRSSIKNRVSVVTNYSYSNVPTLKKDYNSTLQYPGKFTCLDARIDKQPRAVAIYIRGHEYERSIRRHSTKSIQIHTHPRPDTSPFFPNCTNQPTKPAANKIDTMPPQNVLLFGATGQIGSFILDAILSARAQFNRIAIFTSAHTAETKASALKNLKQQNVEIIVGDVEDESAVKAAYEGMHPSRRPPGQSPALPWTISANAIGIGVADNLRLRRARY